MFKELSITERLVLILVLIIVTAGMVFFYTDLSLFEWYIKEDSLAEWLTVLGLMLGSAVSFLRFFHLLKKKSWWFLTVTFLLGLLLFIAAGEEISWGQRILDVKSSEYFQKNNAQGETNFHNLVVDGVKLNKLIFTLVLGIGMAIYLVAVPIIHTKNKKLKTFFDNSGVPVARLYQIIAFVIMSLLTTLIPHGKNAELLECGAALIFFLVIRYPKNSYAFPSGYSASTL